MTNVETIKKACSLVVSALILTGVCAGAANARGGGGGFHGGGFGGYHGGFNNFSGGNNRTHRRGYWSNGFFIPLDGGDQFSNQFSAEPAPPSFLATDAAVRQQDAARVARPDTAFVQSYSWPKSTPTQQPVQQLAKHAGSAGRVL